MTGTLGLMIELMVVGLLLVTIGYCALLDRRLRAVRQDEQMMRKTVVDLSAATERAERAIESLRHTLGDCDRTLAERLRVAERYTTDLEDQIRSGDDVLARISRIVSTTQDQAFHDAPAPAAQQRRAPHAEPAAPAYAAPRPVPVPVPTPAPAAPAPSRLSQTLAAARNLAAQASARTQEGRVYAKPQNEAVSPLPSSLFGQRDYVA
jgi:hypothetical protein